MFNTVLGAGVASRLRNCAVLSASEIAAPAFVAAALGDNTPTSIRLSDGQQLMAVEPGRRQPDRRPVRPRRHSRAAARRASPPTTSAADLVLVSTYGRPQPAPRRVGRHPLRTTRLVLKGGLRRVLVGVAALIATGTVVVARSRT